MKHEQLRVVRLIAVIALLGVGLALTGCVEEDEPGEDEIVPPGQTDGGEGGDDGTTDPAEDGEIHLEDSNVTVDLDESLMQAPPDSEEAGLSLECRADLAGYSWTNPGSPRMAEEPPLHPRELEVMIHDRVNSIREAQDRDPLYCDDDLRRIAIDHGENMHEHDFVDDVDHEGLDPLERMWYNDYQCADAGQNHMVFVYQKLTRDQPGNVKAIGEFPLAADPEHRVGPGERGIVSYDMTSIRNPRQATREIVNSGWFRVDEARDIMLDDDFTRQGIGVYYDYDSSLVYVTQKLC